MEPGVLNSLRTAGSGLSVAARMAEIAERVSVATDCGELQDLLHQGTVALGAERSFFASMSGAGTEARYAFVLDCDPTWWHRYRACAPWHANPWLRYASLHAAPASAEFLEGATQDGPVHTSFAAAAGFRSAALFPVHLGRCDYRTGLLCLGHSTPEHFDDQTLASVRVGARMLATEIHVWWSRHEQEQMRRRILLSPVEVAILRRHWRGLGSKKIADELQLTCKAVDSRFQRVIRRLGVRNRHAAARLALECGLIVG